MGPPPCLTRYRTTRVKGYLPVRATAPELVTRRVLAPTLAHHSPCRPSQGGPLARNATRPQRVSHAEARPGATRARAPRVSKGARVGLAEGERVGPMSVDAKKGKVCSKTGFVICDRQKGKPEIQNVEVYVYVYVYNIVRLHIVARTSSCKLI